MVEAAKPLIEVEQVLASSRLSAKQKTELWTMAWSRLGRRRQAQEIRWITDPAEIR
jgi:hypothetical protein